jgi:hypothetical protein
MKLLTKFANITEITISFRFINIKDSASVNGEIVTKATIINTFKGARVAQWVRSLDLRVHTSLSPIRRGFAPGFVNYKRCTRFAAASEKVYQLLAHGRWFSPGTPASSTTKTGRHDISEILLKVALKHQKSNRKYILRSE